jgi:uncharacterized protein YdiU (UPF0061 family)
MPENISSLNFDNSFVNELPKDKKDSNYTRQVHNACYSLVYPEKPKNPKQVIFSPEAGKLIDLTDKDCNSKEFLDIFSGTKLHEKMQPYAMNYGGHQFGSWAGQLGDGRAINLGEVINKNNIRYTLQLKGAGPTPYSRAGDGYAVFRSSLREFLCSEAMHHLGIPTTRALSLILTGNKVIRDMFYDGNPEYEDGAVLLRLSESFIRFGNFEIFASRNDLDTLKRLIDFTIKKDFPHLGKPGEEVYLQWFKEVLESTIDLVVHWMRVGFVHGVLNTDNMSIKGLTIDYGPYGWLDNYDPIWTPNTTDAQGRRYAFERQPDVVYWNLSKFAGAIIPVIKDVDKLQNELDRFMPLFNEKYFHMMATKLGLKSFNKDVDEVLIRKLLKLFSIQETDMTIFFRKLSDIDKNQADHEKIINIIKDCFYGDIKSEFINEFKTWLNLYMKRLKSEDESFENKKILMDKVNPKFVLRNYISQTAIDRYLEGDVSYLNEVFEIIKNPYDEQDGKDDFFQKRPDWAKNRAGCSMLSCSS